MTQLIGPTILFDSISVYGGTKNILLSSIADHISQNPQKTPFLLKIFTPNPEQMVLAKEDASFFESLSQANVLLPDGAGLVWAIHKRKGEKVQRIAGREVFHDVLKMARDKEWNVFLVGGKPGAAKHIADQSNSRSGIQWAYDDGPKEDVSTVLEKIRNTRPDIVFVAYGAPWQEKWVIENEAALQEAGVRVAMVVGGAFEYEAGLVQAIPSWAEQMRLEWLIRLVREPWRWKRQLKGLKFFIDVLFSRHP